MAGPGVSERMIVPPFSTRGESIRQNGPSSDCEVSVPPLSPLLRRQTSEETPSEPAISTISLWLSVERWPISLSISVAARNSASLRCTSRTKACRCLMSDTMIFRRRGSLVRSITRRTASVTSSWRLMIMTALPGRSVDRNSRIADPLQDVRGYGDQGTVLVRDLDVPTRSPALHVDGSDGVVDRHRVPEIHRG